MSLFDGDFLTVQKLIKEGKLSELRDFESHFDVPANWKLGNPGGSAGMLYGLGSHLLDQAIALFGKPAKVFGLLRNMRGPEFGHPDVDDYFIVHLTYDNSPVVATITSALHSHMRAQPRYIIRGTNSSYVKYHLDPQENQAGAGMKATDPGFGDEDEDKWGELTIGDKSEKVKTETGTYTGYYQNVADTISGKGSLVVTPEQAMLGIQIMEAAKKSNAEGKWIDF